MLGEPIASALRKLHVFTKFNKSKKQLQSAKPMVIGQPAGSLILEYTVGAHTVRLADAGGSVEYYVASKLSPETYRLVEERLDDVLLLLRRGNDLGDVVVTVLGVDRGRASDALYALRTITGYGKLQVLLDDPYITEISVEEPGRVWIRHTIVDFERPEQDFIPTNIVFNSKGEVVQMQQVIATKCGTYLSTSNPIIDTQLPLSDGGHRVHMVFPTVSKNMPEIVIRKKLPMPLQ